MTSEYNQQSFLSKQNVKLPQSLTDESQESNQEQLDIGWIFSVFRRRAWAMMAITITIIGSLGSLVVWQGKQQPPVYEGYFRVLVEPITAEGQLDRMALQKEALTGSPYLQSLTVSADRVDYDSLILVLRSSDILVKIVDKVKEKYPKITLESILPNLQIKRIMVDAKPVPKGTKILDIRYRNSDPEQALFLIQEIAEAYFNYSRQERLTSLKQGIDFIDSQLPELNKRMDKTQQEIQELRQRYEAMEPEKIAPSILNTLDKIILSRLSIEAEITEKKTKLNNLKEQFREGKISEILVERGSFYDTLIKELQKVEGALAQKSSLLREDSPPVKTLRRQQENLQSLLFKEAEKILENLEADFEGIQERYDILLEEENRLNQKIRDLPKAARRYSELQMELQIVNSTVNEFLTKREALSLNYAQQEVPWQSLEAPNLVVNSQGQPQSMAETNTKRKLALVVVLSTLLGLASGFLIEVLIKVFHAPKDIQVATKLPLLGVIPFSKELNKNANKQNKVAAVVALAGLAKEKNNPFLASNNSQIELEYSAPLLEAFRYLYTNVRLLTYESSFHSLVISSATPKDGKSTIAVNIARIAASVGQRVLLVDADLRSPQLHNKLGLPNLRGLSDVITTDLSLNDSIQRWHQDDNLFLLTAGQIPPDPIKLLSSKKMRYLMEQFQAFFDLVVYDTPPLVGLADSSLVAAYTDGMVLVVRIEKTNRSMVTKALEGIKISGSQVLGIVANGVKR